MYNQSLPMGWYVVDGIEKATGGKHSWSQIVKRDSVSSQLLRNVPSGDQVAKMDNEQRRHYYGIFKRWFDTLEDPEALLGDLMDRHWFRPWSKECEILEKRVADLKKYTNALEGDPAILVRFALNAYASLE